MRTLLFALTLAFAAAIPCPERALAATTLTIISLPTRLSSLVGEEVRNLAGRRLGTVKDFVIDLANGRVRYAILDTRYKTVPLPFHALELSLEDEHLLLDASPQRLAQAPERANGADAYWDGAALPRLARASELIGRRFRSAEGELAGKLVDIVIDAHEGNVAFAVISLAGNTLHPVPLSAFAAGEELFFTLRATELDAARHLSLAELNAGLERDEFLRESAAYADRLSLSGS
jgi:sporulation protein YlmC with PRC-barrel domain